MGPTSVTPTFSDHQREKTHTTILLGDIALAKIAIKARISKYIYVKQWELVLLPCPSFNGDLVKPQLEFVHTSMIESFIILGLRILIPT